MIVRLLVAAFAIGFLSVDQSVFARDIYVNNRLGDDARDGSSEKSQGKGAGPVRTIARALKLAKGSDRVILAETGEPYRESITLQAAHNSGIGRKPFILDGRGATLEGRKPVPESAWEAVAPDTFRFRPHKKSASMLYVDGRPGTRVHVPSTATRYADLQPKQWCLFRGNVYFRVEADRRLSDYELEHAALPVGITLYDVHRVVIVNLIVQGFQLDGINAHNNVSDTQMIGLISRGNGRAGISVGGSSRVRIEASLLGNNGEAQIRTEGYSHTQVINCDLLENPAPKILRKGGKVFVENDDTGDDNAG